MFQGAFDKVTACWEVQQELGIADHEVAYVGDDLVDIGLMQRVGIGITVADAHPRVLAVADWVTARRGGGGAFREVVDDIVGARDLWDRVTADYARRQRQE